MFKHVSGKKGEDHQSVSWCGGGSRVFFFLVIVLRHTWLRLRRNSFTGRNGRETLKTPPRMARVNFFASAVSKPPCHGLTDEPTATRSERTTRERTHVKHAALHVLSRSIEGDLRWCWGEGGGGLIT